MNSIVWTKCFSFIFKWKAYMCVKKKNFYFYVLPSKNFKPNVFPFSFSKWASSEARQRVCVFLFGEGRLLSWRPWRPSLPVLRRSYLSFSVWLNSKHVSSALSQRRCARCLLAVIRGAGRLGGSWRQTNATGIIKKG